MIKSDNYTIGIDIGGTNFRIGLVSEKGEIHSFEKKSSNMFDGGDVVETLKTELTEYIAKNGSNKRIKAAAIGIPSIVSKDKKTIYSTPNLKGFDNIYFGDRLSNAIGFPVFIDRDVNFLLQNDVKKLALDTENKIICGFYVGTGYGNAILMNGKFLAGKNGAAGELGHIPLYGIEEECNCKNPGCSEVRCSGKRLEYLVKKHFPDTAIGDVFREHRENPVLLDYVRDLALPAATEINILDPDYIILAGGVLYMDCFPKDILVDEIHRRTRKPYPERTLDIRFSEHTQQSGVYGSGCFAHSQIK